MDEVRHLATVEPKSHYNGQQPHRGGDTGGAWDTGGRGVGVGSEATDIKETSLFIHYRELLELLYT